MFLIVSRLSLIIIILLQTIFLLRLSHLVKIWSILTVPLIVSSLKAEVGRSIMLALTREHLILSKGESYTQYFDIIWLSNILKLANMYK